MRIPEAKVEFRFVLNGIKKTVVAFPMARLLDVLRQVCNLTGTKEGCGEGECGACSVLLNGELANSCLIPIAQVEGQSVETIEGISKKTEDLQASFIRYGGAQCGICTPGMMMAALKCRENSSALSDLEIREKLSGNLCRCTGYQKIIDSIRGAL